MNDKKTVSFGMALAIIFLPILVILLGGLVLRVGFLVPLMLATITASLLSIMAGFTWKEVEACIVNGVHRIIIVTCILFLVGTLDVYKRQTAPHQFPHPPLKRLAMLRRGTSGNGTFQNGLEIAIELELAVVIQNHRPLHEVFQFPDVAGPVILLSLIHISMKAT